MVLFLCAITINFIWYFSAVARMWFVQSVVWTFHHLDPPFKMADKSSKYPHLKARRVRAAHLQTPHTFLSCKINPIMQICFCLRRGHSEEICYICHRSLLAFSQWFCCCVDKDGLMANFLPSSLSMRNIYLFAVLTQEFNRKTIGADKH